jgi:hypothetical protein
MFNKIYLSVIITLLLIPLSNLFSQASPQEYKCLEFSNGVPTGYTIVLTVAQLPNDVVQVTRTRQTSSIEDNEASYNLTSQSFEQVSENEVTLTCVSSTWFIPFGGGFGDPFNPFGTSDLTVTYTCFCRSGDGVCRSGWLGSIFLCLPDSASPCRSCCIRESGIEISNDPFGPGLMIEAPEVICIDQY